MSSYIFVFEAIQVEFQSNIESISLSQLRMCDLREKDPVCTYKHSYINTSMQWIVFLQSFPRSKANFFLQDQCISNTCISVNLISILFFRFILKVDQQIIFGRPHMLFPSLTSLSASLFPNTLFCLHMRVSSIYIWVVNIQLLSI